MAPWRMMPIGSSPSSPLAWWRRSATPLVPSSSLPLAVIFLHNARETPARSQLNQSPISLVLPQGIISSGLRVYHMNLKYCHFDIIICDIAYTLI